MTTVHFMMGEKGGVGKTTSAVFCAQGLENAERKAAIIELEPATSTLQKYKGLEIIEILNMINPDTKVIDASKFDDLIEIANERTDLDDIIIDTGSSNCIEFFNYLVRNDTFELFEAEGHRVIIHLVVLGGDHLNTTLKTLGKIQELFPETDKIVWLNEYLHKIRIGDDGVEAIGKTNEFKSAKKSILAAFRLPLLMPNTEVPFINKMHEEGILFKELRSSNLFKVAAKHRLEKFAKIVIGQISDGMKKILTKNETSKSEKETA